MADTEDYSAFLNQKHWEKTKSNARAERDFWLKKLEGNDSNYVWLQKLAFAEAALFKVTGNAQHIQTADSILVAVHNRIPTDVGNLQALAQVCITQHEFVRAEDYLKLAIKTGENLGSSTLMLVDVQLERGDLMAAEQNLKSLKNANSFGYKIRAMKLADNQDNLTLAIQEMEAAAEKVKAANNLSLMNWSYSNLGDMYGHNAEIKKSYQTYLKALALDSADLHSLQGIAWINYAQDGNIEEARRIINWMHEFRPVPDHFLFLAELADFEGKDEEADTYRQEFIREAEKPVYGKMYRSYLADLYLDIDPNRAMEMALAEVEERPHPTSFALLARAELANGNEVEALRITKEHVLGFTGEPDALLGSAEILAHNGDLEQAQDLYNELMEAKFELGPLAERDMRSVLQTL